MNASDLIKKAIQANKDGGLSNVNVYLELALEELKRQDSNDLLPMNLLDQDQCISDKSNTTCASAFEINTYVVSYINSKKLGAIVSFQEIAEYLLSSPALKLDQRLIGNNKRWRCMLSDVICKLRNQRYLSKTKTRSHYMITVHP
jgi:hypothetical protein